MKINQVTWYSKLLALVLFIVLPFIGFWLGMKYENATKVLNKPKDEVVSGYKPIIDTDEITVETKYENGLLKYKGRAQALDSCNYSLTKTSIVNDLGVSIKIDVQIHQPGPPLMICEKAKAELPFSGSVQTVGNTKLEIFFNGSLIE